MPTPGQPIWAALADTWPASPVTRELLNTTTGVLARSTWGLGVGFADAEGDPDGVPEAEDVPVGDGDIDCCWEVVVICLSGVSEPWVNTNATAAMPMATMLRMTTGEGKTTPRWPRRPRAVRRRATG